MDILTKLLERDDIGIDLGSANMRVWVKGRGLVMDEPSAEHSFRSGVIPDFDTAKKALRYCLAKVDGGSLRRPRVLLSVHSDIIEEQKKTLEKAAQAAGAKEVYMLESPMAAAIGAGLKFCEPQGRMVVNVGASTTESVVISLAGIVHAKLIHVGGDAMNSDIDVLGQIAGVAKELLDITDPELAADLVDTGIVLTGGGALMRGLDKRIAEVTGLPVRVADDPARATIRGLSVVLDELDFLAKVKKR